MPVSPVVEGDTITTAWGNSVSTAVGALEAATPYKPGGTDVAVADGGTGASSAGSARGNLGLGATNVPAFAGITFPIPPTDAAGAGVLDAYEEGAWPTPPALAYNNPGNSSWATALASAAFTRIGNRVFFHFTYQGVPTNGNATGNLVLSGLPYPAGTAVRVALGEAGGWTKAGYTMLGGLVASGGTVMTFRASGSGLVVANVTVADIPSGGTVLLTGSGFYTVQAGLVTSKPAPEQK